MSAFSTQSSGLGSLVVGGVVLLVVVAVGFSALSDGLFEKTAAARLNEERAGRVHDLLIKVSRLKEDLAEQERYLGELDTKKEPFEEEKRLQVELEILQDEAADLALTATEEEDAIVEIGNEKRRYRGTVREEIWPRYLNQELEAKHLRGGVEFKNARISKIDAAGVTVKHASGVSRVEVLDLAPEFREKLDLSLTEARRVMTDLLLKDARGKQFRERQAHQQRAGQPTAAEPKDQVEKYFSLIRRADETARVARYNDRYSSSRSASGKLETWGARAVRFEGAAARYREQFSASVLDVRKLEPRYRPPQ
jgi:hypothetical protein